MKIIILAGGSGTRLWPVSRETFPKQFLKLGSDESLLQKTVRRFLPEWPISDIFIVTNRDSLFLVKDQVAKIDAELLNQIIVEPSRRNTAPAIALAIQHLQDVLSIEKEEIVFICSSDHWIEPKNRFLTAIYSAEKIAAQGRIVTFGVQPNKPETGYGYIEVNQTDEGASVLEAISFTEKPHLELAKKYLMSGNYLWNSGMFAFSIETFWEEASLHCIQLKQEAFEQMPSISIDYALMEKSKRMSVILLDVAWSDIGSWDTVFDVMEKDESQNVKMGNVLAMDTNNSLILGASRLIVAVGLENALVVETEDALYIGKRDESQRVKAVVEELKKLEKREAMEHLTIQRPWGYYTILEEGTRYKVKRIFVAPHQKLSLQMHRHRNEHWVIVKGVALATIGASELLVCENESIYIPKATMHRLTNPQETALELIEVQVGEYVGEDDIIRFEDIYGRKTVEKIQVLN